VREILLTVFRFIVIRCAMSVEGVMEVQYEYKSNVKNECRKGAIVCTVYGNEMC